MKAYPRVDIDCTGNAIGFDVAATFVLERLRSWLTNKYVRLKWADPEWAAALTASRERASKAAASKVAAPGARGRKSALKGAVGKAGGARPRKMGKMPSLSSDG